MFSATEKERRIKALQQLLSDDDLKAILLIGDAGNGFGFSGDYRYFTDNRTITYRELLVVFPDSEAVLLRLLHENCRRLNAGPLWMTVGSATISWMTLSNS